MDWKTPGNFFCVAAARCLGRRGALLLTAIAAGAIFALAFEAKAPPWFIGGALVPFVLPLFLSAWTYRALFVWGLTAGTTACSIYLRWFFAILPLNWVGIETSPFIIGVVAATVLLAAAFLGLFFGLLFVMVRAIARRNVGRTVLALVVLWPVFEYVRTLAFSFHPYILGPGTIGGDHYGFLLLGYALADAPMLRAYAPFLGDYGLSMVVLLPAVACTVFLSIALRARLEANSTHRSITVGIMCLSAFSLLVLVGPRLRTLPSVVKAPLSVAIVETAFPTADVPSATPNENAHAREEITRRRAVVAGLFARALETDPDIIVMPESTPTVFRVPDMTPYPDPDSIREAAGIDRYRVIIDTALPPKKWKSSSNPVTVLDTAAGVIGTYEKRFLMPWGEYTPYVTDFVSRLLGLDWRDRVYRYRPGSTTGVFSTRRARIAVLLCSELHSPSLAREAGRLGAEILMFSSSEAILRGAKQLQRQNLAMAQIRAAMLRKPLIYAANSGLSFALDMYGDVLWRSEGPREGVAVVSVVPNREKTTAAYLLP